MSMRARRITLSEQKHNYLIFLLETKANKKRETTTLSDESEWASIAIGVLCLVAVFIILFT